MFFYIFVSLSSMVTMSKISPLSKARIAVIIFEIDATDLFKLIFFPAKTSLVLVFMTIQLEQLNLSDSTFNNPSGLDIDDEGNISTSFDIASLYSYCLDNNLFKAIVSTKNYSINNVSWRNKNKLLHRYQYCTGGKTGYTYKAKRTLVTSAKKEDFELVIVTLNCGNDFSIHESLYEYFFNNYYYINFLEKGINYINDKIIKSEKNIGLTIEKNKLDDNTYKIYRFDNNNNLLECQLRKNNEILWSRFLNE